MPVDRHSSIGFLLKEERKNKNLTQEQLAEMIGTTNTHISKWERGEVFPTDNYIAKLAKALSVPEITIRSQIQTDKRNYFDLRLNEEGVSYESRTVLQQLEAASVLINNAISTIKNKKNE